MKGATSPAKFYLTKGVIPKNLFPKQLNPAHVLPLLSGLCTTTLCQLETQTCVAAYTVLKGLGFEGSWRGLQGLRVCVMAQKGLKDLWFSFIFCPP